MCARWDISKPLRAVPIQFAIAGLITIFAQPAGRTVRETPIKILERGQETSSGALAGQSDWPEEVIANRIEKTLQEFVHSPSAPGASFVSTEFRGAQLRPRELM